MLADIVKRATIRSTNISDDTALSINLMSTVICSISMLAGVIVIVTYIYIRIHHRTLDRLSLRLTAYVAMSDLLFCASQIWNDRTVVPGVACTWSIWAYVFTDLCAVFFVTCIAINLQIVFVHQCISAKYLEYYYVIGSISLALVISLTPFMAHQEVYGFNDGLNSCWITLEGDGKREWWSFLVLYGWILLTILYCSVAIFAVLVKVWGEEKKIDQQFKEVEKASWLRRYTTISIDHHMGINALNLRNQNNVSEEIMSAPVVSFANHPSQWPRHSGIGSFTTNNSLVLHTVKRIIWYPIILILTQSWNIINYINMAAAGYTNLGVYVVSYISVGLQGVLTLCVFAGDPAVSILYRAWRSGTCLECAKPADPSCSPHPAPSPRPADVEMDLGEFLSSDPPHPLSPLPPHPAKAWT